MNTARGQPVRALITMPVGTARGGSELQLQQLIEYRAEAGIAPTVAFLAPGPMVDWCRAQGVRTVLVDAGRLRQPRRFGRAVRTLATLARDTDAEIVIGWMAKGHLYGGIVAAVTGLPNMWLQVGLPVGSLLDRVAALLPAALVITVSRTVDRAQRQMRPRRPTRLIYPAVDTRRFDAGRIGEPRTVRERLGLPQDALIFGSVGRLQHWKGFDVLLDVVPEVLEHHPAATVVIVGGRHDLEPGCEAELRARAAALGRDGHARLVGHQPNPEEWIQAMDVFAHTSDNEPFGIVVIEAMALGKPVIATDTGGPTEIITPGVDGLLSPYGDRRALTDAILHYLGDENFRRTIGQAAGRRAQHFSVQEFARRFGGTVAEVARPAD